MTRRLHIWRPEPGWSASAAVARKLGLEPAGEPLFAIEPVRWSPPPPDTFDGLLIGSANVFRHGGDQLAALRSLPVHVVGETTAAAAKEAGFTVAGVGQGGLQNVVDRLGGAGRFLRLRGEAAVDLNLPEGCEVEDIVVYAARPRTPSDETLTDLKTGGVAVLHSGEAAARFAGLVDDAGASRSSWKLALIGPRLAPILGEGWADVRIASTPHDAALLELAAGLCKEG